MSTNIILTEDLLNFLGVCEIAIQFAKNQNFHEYVQWLKDNYKISVEYDEKGNCASIIDFYGNRRNYEYDEKGNLIYSIDSYDIRRNYEYDENGNCICWNTSYNFWKRYEYDEKGNLIYSIDSYDFWKRYEYDENGNCVYTFRTQNSVNGDDASITRFYKFEYYSNGQLKRIICINNNQEEELLIPEF